MKRAEGRRDGHLRAVMVVGIGGQRGYQLQRFVSLKTAIVAR